MKNIIVILSIGVFLFSFLNGQEIPEATVRSNPFKIIKSKDGFSLYLKEVGKEARFEESFSGGAGKDYVYQVINGGLDKGIIGFYASGRGMVFIDHGSKEFLIKFDTDKKAIQVFECSKLESK